MDVISINNLVQLQDLKSNLGKVCRMCLKSDDNLLGIFDCLNVKDILMSLFEIDVTDENREKLPSLICNKCMESAKEAADFIQMCKNSDKIINQCMSLVDDSKDEVNGYLSSDDDPVQEDEVVEEPAEPAVESGSKINTIENIFKCSFCSIEVERLVELKKHIKKAHPEEMQALQNELENKFICIICNQLFSQYQTLARHEKIHQADQKNKQCTYCGKCFIRSDDLKRHTRIHTGERPYACNQCPKSYKQSSELKEHQKSHSAMKHYMCSICGKELATRNGLYVHLKVHRGEKNHECQVCGKTFVTTGELTSHQNHIHSKEKPFSCPIDKCTRAFVTKISLKTHVRAHNGEKLFKCSTCGKHLATASSLHEHKRTHTGIKPKQCHICHRRLGNSQSLKKHIRIHTGERPYQCELCSDKFICASSLSAHTKIKHQKREFECHICQKVFSLNEKLDQHLRSHAEEIMDNIKEK